MNPACSDIVVATSYDAIRQASKPTRSTWSTPAAASPFVNAASISARSRMSLPSVSSGPIPGHPAPWFHRTTPYRSAGKLVIPISMKSASVSGDPTLTSSIGAELLEVVLNDPVDLRALVVADRVVLDQIRRVAVDQRDDVHVVGGADLTHLEQVVDGERLEVVVAHHVQQHGPVGRGRGDRVGHRRIGRRDRCRGSVTGGSVTGGSVAGPTVSPPVVPVEPAVRSSAESPPLHATSASAPTANPAIRRRVPRIRPLLAVVRKLPPGPPVHHQYPSDPRLALAPWRSPTTRPRPPRRSTASS